MVSPLWINVCGQRSIIQECIPVAKCFLMLVFVSFCLCERHDGSLSLLAAHNFCAFVYFHLFWIIWTWRWITPNTGKENEAWICSAHLPTCRLVSLTLDQICSSSKDHQLKTCLVSSHQHSPHLNRPNLSRVHDSLAQEDYLLMIQWHVRFCPCLCSFLFNEPSNSYFIML